jgi:hypothetical protein
MQKQNQFYVADPLNNEPPPLESKLTRGDRFNIVMKVDCLPGFMLRGSWESEAKNKDQLRIADPMNNQLMVFLNYMAPVVQVFLLTCAYPL